MDIVIPLGLGSRWNNNELRYALRSAEMYIKDIGEVYILGKAPSWIDNIIEVDLPDISEYPATNIFHKVNEFCKIRSTPFLFMNDDHYLQPAFKSTEYYYEGTLQGALNKSKNILYSNVIENTIEVLTHDEKYFDVHTPIKYDPFIFRTLVGCEDWSKRWGYLNKSLYCTYMKHNTVEIHDGKINNPKSINELIFFADDKVCLSSGNEINDVFKKYLQLTYPNKSKYEK